jgi:hypothetical protein
MDARTQKVNEQIQKVFSDSKIEPSSVCHALAFFAAKKAQLPLPPYNHVQAIAAISETSVSQVKKALDQCAMAYPELAEFAGPENMDYLRGTARKHLHPVIGPILFFLLSLFLAWVAKGVWDAIRMS